MIYKAFILLLFFQPVSNALFSQSEPDTTQVYKNLEEALENKEHVYHLKLTWKRYKEFPPEIFEFPNLRTLNLKRNKITEIPDEIALLKNLRELDLTRNKLKSVNPKVGELTKLRILNLGMNDIETLPAELVKLENLEEISIWGNLVTSLPPEFKNFKNLKLIDFQQIQHKPAEQKQMKSVLPENVEIRFSPPCNCM